MINIQKPRVTFGNHCHERVLMALEAAMEIQNGAFKSELAEFANTSEAVVSNAIHDWKKGLYTRDGQPIYVEKVTVNRKAYYSLPLQGELAL